VRAIPIRYLRCSFLHLIGKDEIEKTDAECQTDRPDVVDKAVQTWPEFDLSSSAADHKPEGHGGNLGSKENPLNIDDDDEFNPHGAISDDEPADEEPQTTEQASDEDKFFFGSVFEKVEEFDQHLDEPNPWHPHLAKPLFPSQIIGFRWMLNRHAKGGGLIGDKVGCGKVLPQNRGLVLRTDLPSRQFYSRPQEHN
jgi:SNF2 family DNA or RNA helicase